MSGPHELRRFADDTRPRDHAANRVRARALETADLRVHERAMAALRRPWIAAGVGVSLAAAGVLLTVFVQPPEPAELVAELNAVADWETLTASEDVQMHFQGRGSLAGTEQAPDITWETGTVRLAVEPERGIDLRVRTPEVLVRVLGTRFAVHRDAKGSHVEVQRGLVSVTCTGGEELKLPPGRVHTCVPVTAAGLLARAQALDEDRVALDTVLETLDAGLESADGPVAAELRFYRVSAFAGRGLFKEALAAAVALDGPHAGHRRAELGPLILRLAYRVDGCDGAAEHRDRLADGVVDPLEGRCE